MLPAMSGASVHERFANTGVVVVCRDGPQGLAARAAATPAHLAYIDSVIDEINVAGPLYDEAGLTVVGSLYSLRTQSLARARQIIESDPFYRAGAFGSVEYFPHLPAAGHYVGGKIW
jgi:uncharacterized protein YciI